MVEVGEPLADDVRRSDVAFRVVAPTTQAAPPARPDRPTGPARPPGGEGDGESPAPAPAVPGADGRRMPAFHLGHRPELDGIRGLAMLLVLVFHLGVVIWPAAHSWLLPNGYVGVDLFFVLSGFLITSLLLGELDRRGRVDVRGFLWRRVVRLVPALAVVLALALVAAAVGFGPHTVGELLVIDASTLAFVNNWFAPEHVTREMGQTWSVAVEGQFYLAWALVVGAVVTAAPRRARQLLVAVAGLGIVAVAVSRAIRYEDGANPFVLYLQTTARLDAPLVGTIAGVAYASGWLDRVPRWAAAAMTVVGLVGMAYAALVLDMYDDVQFKGGFTLVAVIGALLVTGAVLLAGGRLATLLTRRPLVLAGTISYSVFLWHVPVFVFVDRDAEVLPLPLEIAVALAATLILATLSYRLVERPLMDRVRPAPAGRADSLRRRRARWSTAAQERAPAWRPLSPAHTWRTRPRRRRRRQRA